MCETNVAAGVGKKKKRKILTMQHLEITRNEMGLADYLVNLEKQTWISVNEPSATKRLISIVKMNVGKVPFSLQLCA